MANLFTAHLGAFLSYELVIGGLYMRSRLPMWIFYLLLIVKIPIQKH